MLEFRNLAQPAQAFDLAGAWTTNADRCAKVFARRGRARQVAFRTFSGVYGGGFIAEINRHLSAMQTANLAATSGHASNDKRSADISSLDSLRIKSLRPSIIRWRMNGT